ncbi:hypothetical protein D3C85_1062640 [compost metagenome]
MFQLNQSTGDQLFVGNIDYIPQDASVVFWIVVLLPDIGRKVFAVAQPQYFPEAAHFAFAAGHAAQDYLEHVVLGKQVLNKGFAHLS